MADKVTEEEKLDKLQKWDASGLSSWKFNEATGLHEPPVMHPHEALEAEVGLEIDKAVDAPEYTWDEDTISWVEVSDG